MFQDITGIIKSTGVALEQEAFKQFGAAVEDSISGPLRDIFKLPKGDSQDVEPLVGKPGVWSPTHYASALVKHDQVEFNPKLKFLFKVSFEFDPAMIEAARRLGHDLTNIQRNVSFLIRHIDRPKFDFDYEEVNLYNYHTKVLKTSKHREVSFTLYDDVGNNALSFINVYRKLIVPSARRVQDPSGHPEDHGFAFDRTMRGLDTSIRGALANDAINVLRKMTIHQIFVERGSKLDDPSSWVKIIDFVFVNPRFTNIDIDDLDHENGSNFTLVTASMDFDTMFMDEPKAATQANMAPNLPSGDIPANSRSGIAPEGGTRNPFVDIIVNQSARAAQQVFSNVVNKALGNSVGGRIIAGKLSRVGGVLAEATRSTLGGVSSGANAKGAVARPTAPVLSDTNSAPAQIQNLSSQTTSDNGGP